MRGFAGDYSCSGLLNFIYICRHFALPFDADATGFTKEFIGAKRLLAVQQPDDTHPVVGENVCKVSSAGSSVVLDSEENIIGSVLTCVTDMGIGWHLNKIYSIASPGKPADFTPPGPCCEFVRVHRKLETGQTLFLLDNRRTIRVRVVDDIRPDRSAGRVLSEMFQDLSGRLPRPRSAPPAVIGPGPCGPLLSPAGIFLPCFLEALQGGNEFCRPPRSKSSSSDR